MIVATYQPINEQYKQKTDENLRKFLDFDPIWAFPANNVRQFWANNLLTDYQLPEQLTVFNPTMGFAINRIQWKQYLNGEIPFSEVFITNDPNVVYLANQSYTYEILVPAIENEVYTVNMHGFSKKYEEKLTGKHADYFFAMIENAIVSGRIKASNDEAKEERYIAENLAKFYRNTFLNDGEAVKQYCQIVGYLGEVQFNPKSIGYIKNHFGEVFPQFAKNPSKESLQRLIQTIEEETLVY